MPVGGARPGAGRPLGSVTKRTREIANKLVEDGPTPLEVMIANMRFAHAAAEAKLAALPDATKRGYRAALAAVVRFRQIAQDAAKDAAPYVHPKLAAIEMTASATVRHVISDVPLTEEEFEQEVAARTPPPTTH